MKYLKILGNFKFYIDVTKECVYQFQVQNECRTSIIYIHFKQVSAMSPFAIALDFIVDEYTAGKGKCPPVARRKRKSVYIASIEKGAVLLDSLIDAQRANEIGLVVVDELHLIGEKGRGACLEALLTKVMYLNGKLNNIIKYKIISKLLSIIKTLAKIQIVGMSATIGNLSEISEFLKADVYTRGFRPIELKEYIKCGRDILEINLQGKTLEEIFVFSRSVNFNVGIYLYCISIIHIFYNYFIDHLFLHSIVKLYKNLTLIIWLD